MVELPVVRRTVQHTIFLHPERGGTPSVQVQGIVPIQDTDEVRQLGDAHSIGMAGRTSIYGEEDGPLVLGAEDGASRMLGVDERAIARFPATCLSVHHQ